MRLTRAGAVPGRLLAGACVVSAMVAMLGVSPVQAARALDPRWSAAAGGPGLVPAPDWKDDAIRRAFRDVLDREPSSSELRDYRRRIDRDGWRESDIRDDLRARYRDRGRDRYRDDRDRDGQSRRIDREEADRIIRRAYLDILHREPDYEGLRTYRRELIENGWSEQELRRVLRQSGEREVMKERDAERIIRRLYQELLGREPDNRGLLMYRNHMVFDRWDEGRVRDALMESPEYRERNRMTRDKAIDIVRRAYRNVLQREPDPSGLDSWVGKVMRERMTQDDVERELRRSDEYRRRR